MEKDFLKGIYILTGTTIGVGFFSLPYILSQVGFLRMLFYFLFLGIVVFLIHQFFGELAILTPDFKRMPGFARIYLGKIGEKVAFFSAIFGIYGTLLAYLILGGNFLGNFFGIPQFFSILIYFFAGSTLVYFGTKAISKIEFLDVLLFSLILILILIFGQKFLSLPQAATQNPNFFLPYGPILFSLWGASVIPEVEEILTKKKNLKRVIFFSILISAIFYFVFSALVFAISKEKTSEDAISGLKDFLPPPLIKLLFLFGFATSFTSFVSLGLTLRKIFWYDFKIGKNTSFFFSCLPPLALYFLGFQKFLTTISFVGAICLGIEGILILAMYYKKFKGKISPFKTSLILALAVFLLVGIILEFKKWL